MSNLDIVNLIENNPLTKLGPECNGKLINKVKNNFNNFEQQLFITSFYCYLNYDPVKDFVIDLDNVWKWLGFCQKQRAKELLEKHFNIQINYKILLTSHSEQKKHGGSNIKKIFMNIKTSY